MDSIASYPNQLLPYEHLSKVHTRNCLLVVPVFLLILVQLVTNLDCVYQYFPNGCGLLKADVPIARTKISKKVHYECTFKKMLVLLHLIKLCLN